MYEQPEMNLNVCILQVFLPKPLGVRFTRGNDGGAYVVRTDAKLGSSDSQIEVITCSIHKARILQSH